MSNILNLDRWKQINETIYVENKRTVETAFSDDEQKELYNIEEESWWFQYRASVIISFMKRFFQKKVVTVDIGGGNGYTACQAMKEGFNFILVEPSLEACKNAVHRGLPYICCGSISEDGIVEESISQALLLDVLEHIKNDSHFLRILYQKMAWGGYY